MNIIQTYSISFLLVKELCGCMLKATIDAMYRSVVHWLAKGMKKCYSGKSKANYLREIADNNGNTTVVNLQCAELK